MIIEQMINPSTSGAIRKLLGEWTINTPQMQDDGQNCCKNKGIRSCSWCSVLVTKVKMLENKVLKSNLPKKLYFPKKTLVTKLNRKYPNLIPLFSDSLISKLGEKRRFLWGRERVWIPIYGVVK